jgi:hypothetical protein
MKGVDPEGLQSRRCETSKTRKDNYLLFAQSTSEHVHNNMKDDLSYTCLKRLPLGPIDVQWSQTTEMARKGKGHTMAKQISFFV